MYNMLVIGNPGEGKSPFVQKYIDGRNCFVFDLHNEYGLRVKYPGQKPLMLSNNINDKRARQTDFNMKTFIQNCLRKQNTVCVFEDATFFFKGYVPDELRRVMLSRLFNNNVNVFIFHSIRTVPPDVMSYANYVILFKTGDEPYQVEDKYPSIYPYYEKLRQAPKGSKFIISKNV
jgi:hypothetical protein